MKIIFEMELGKMKPFCHYIHRRAMDVTIYPTSVEETDSDYVIDGYYVMIGWVGRPLLLTDGQIKGVKIPKNKFKEDWRLISKTLMSTPRTEWWDKFKASWS